MTDPTAVIVIDMQNGFCYHPAGGLQDKMGWPALLDIPAVVSATGQLLAESRRKGIPVVYVKYETLPDLTDGMLSFKETQEVAALPAGTVLSMEGEEGEIVTPLTPQPGDHVIPKTRWDSFMYTRLEPLLRGLGVENLVLCGVLTHACVETTARSALQRDYRVWVAADCVTSESVDLHEGSLRSMDNLGATIAPWAAALEGAVAGLAAPTMTTLPA